MMIRVCLFLVMLLMGPVWANAGANQDCGQTKDLDRRISGCTSIIQAGNLPKEHLTAAYGARGHAYGKKGEHALAIKDFTRVIKFKPDNKIAYLSRAVSYEKTGQREKAIADYEKTYDLAKNSKHGDYAKEALARLGVKALTKDEKYEKEVLRAVGGVTVDEILNSKLPEEVARRQAKRKASIAAFKAELNNPSIPKPEKSVVLVLKQSADAYSRGLAFRKKRQYDQAITEHTKAIKLNPKNAEAYLDRGRARYAKSDIDGAIADYTQVLKLNPKETKALNNRGISYRNKGIPDKAIRDLSAALKIDPKFFGFYYNRGLAYHDKGQHDHAIADFNAALRLNPKFSDAHNSRGSSHYGKGEYDRAIADYDTAIKLNPKMYNAYRNRGNAYKKIGNIWAATADYKKAKELNPKIVINPPVKETAKPAKNKGAKTATNEMDLAFWNDVKNSNDPAMLQAYLDQFPKGTFAALARIKIEKLKKPQ